MDIQFDFKVSVKYLWLLKANLKAGSSYTFTFTFLLVEAYDEITVAYMCSMHHTVDILLITSTDYLSLMCSSNVK